MTLIDLITKNTTTCHRLSPSVTQLSFSLFLSALNVSPHSRSNRVAFLSPDFRSRVFGLQSMRKCLLVSDTWRDTRHGMHMHRPGLCGVWRV